MVEIERFFQGSLFFLSGIVVILAIVGIVYFISWCFDTATGDDLLTPDELEARRVAPILVRQAGLAGILKDEQTKVIKVHFEANSFPFVKEVNWTDPKNEKSLKDTKEVTPSTDDKPEEGEKPEGSEDKEIEHMEQGLNDDALDDDDDTKEKVGEKVETSKDKEIEKTKETSGEEETVESSAPESIEKSEESVDDGSPTTTEEEQQGTCSICEGGHSELLSTVKAGLGLEDEETKESDDEKSEGSKDKESSDKKEKSSAINDELEEAEEGICSICLEDYENGERVIIGTSCGHMFHLNCWMQWVEKKHMTCPICRSDMITPDEFTASSFQVLGEERVDKIRRINEESARRMEEAFKKQEEEQRRQQPQAAPVPAPVPTAEPEPAPASPSSPPATETADVESGPAPDAPSDVSA